MRNQVHRRRPSLLSPPSLFPISSLSCKNRLAILPSREITPYHHRPYPSTSTSSSKCRPPTFSIIPFSQAQMVSSPYTLSRLLERSFNPRPCCQTTSKQKLTK